MNHALKGCIKFKGRIYLPLEEVVALLKHLASVRGDAIADSLTKSFAKADIPEVEGRGLLEKVKSLFSNDAKL